MALTFPVSRWRGWWKMRSVWTPCCCCELGAYRHSVMFSAHFIFTVRNLDMLVSFHAAGATYLTVTTKGSKSSASQELQSMAAGSKAEGPWWKGLVEWNFVVYGCWEAECRESVMRHIPSKVTPAPPPETHLQCTFSLEHHWRNSLVSMVPPWANLFSTQKSLSPVKLSIMINHHNWEEGNMQLLQIEKNCCSGFRVGRSWNLQQHHLLPARQL